jgi:hypothetical protein
MFIYLFILDFRRKVLSVFLFFVMRFNDSQLGCDLGYPPAVEKVGISQSLRLYYIYVTTIPTFVAGNTLARFTS